MAKAHLESNMFNAGGNIKIETTNHIRRDRVVHNHYYGKSQPIKGPQLLKSPETLLQSLNASEVLRGACMTGNVAVATGLLKSGSIPNINQVDDDNKTFLHLAAEGGYADIVELLLEHPGINFKARDDSDCTAFDLALQNGQQEVLNLLFDHPGVYPDPDADTYEDGDTALLYASFNGETDIVDVLLARTDVAINERNKYGNTALMLASSENHTRIVSLLLEHDDVDLGVRNEDGDTALHLASENGHVEIVQLLLPCSDDDLNAQNNTGNTPLLKACYGGHIEVVKLLFEQKGLDPQIQNHDGKTALIVASAKRQRDIKTILMQKRGSPAAPVGSPARTAGTTANRGTVGSTPRSTRGTARSTISSNVDPHGRQGGAKQAPSAVELHESANNPDNMASGTYTIRSTYLQKVVRLKHAVDRFELDLAFESGADNESWIIRVHDDKTITIRNKAFSDYAFASVRQFSSGEALEASNGHAYWKWSEKRIIAHGFAWQVLPNGDCSKIVLKTQDSANSAQLFELNKPK